MDNQSPFQPWTSDDSAKNVKTEGELVDDAKLHRENVNHPKHRQTASYIKESVAASSNAPGSSIATAPGGEPDRGKESKMDPNKIASMQQFVENTLSQEGRQRVAQLIDAVEALNGAERLLLYLRLPTGVPQHDPLKQPINPLGSRAELQQTVTWIQTHLEVDPDVSLPKQDVYDEYIAHCMSSNMKPLSTADFGKVMKQVYPSVRPRRLGTRGNSRYCYAGLRKKIKLEVPQLPDLGESSKLQESNVSTVRETERIVCEWAEAKLGIKFSSLTELARHLMSGSVQNMLPGPGPASVSPPPIQQSHATTEDTSRQLIKHLKRKIQTQGTPGRPKKNKGPETAGVSPPSTSYGSAHVANKPEGEVAGGDAYYPPYGYGAGPYAQYAPPPPRAHPPPEYRVDPYAFEPYPRDPALPINLSADASLDLSTERSRAPAQPPPQPPPAPRLPLPGKKLILETYQSEARAAAEPHYLPKKMRAAESLGGKLAAARVAPPAPPPPDPRPPPAPAPAPTLASPQVAFLEDPKNFTSRSKSTAAALAREDREAASGARAGRGEARDAGASPDLDGIGLRTGVICGERHSEILTRERVISICNIDKHDLDDYLNEGGAQEHDEELLQYFPRRGDRAGAAPEAPQAPPQPSHQPPAFLDAPQDPQDDHSQGKSEKISQLRELLAKNLKNSSGSSTQSAQSSQEQELLQQNDSHEREPPGSTISDGAFKAVSAPNEIVPNGPILSDPTNLNFSKHGNSVPVENGISSYVEETSASRIDTTADSVRLYNGHCHNEPQSPTSRTQQYDFVPISEGCHSPGNFHSKSPLGFNHRSQSPSKLNKMVNMCGSLQTSPISHSTAASPFVSPRNTPVPRSRLCPRPIPKLNGRKRRNPLTLGMIDPCSKQFVMPNDQKFITKSAMCMNSMKYCQPISAPPSPNILSQYKTHMYPCSSGLTNGSNNLTLSFLPHPPFRDHVNGDPPLSADPLSTEVSQFFQESIVPYRTDTFRSQSVPLKQGIGNMGLLSYNNTPVGSVPPTPVPNEFCDFGSLDTCDISRAGLNRETLDKIYDAIDSSNDVLTADATQSILTSNDALTNGCDPLPEHPILSDEQLTSIIPGGDDLLDRPDRFDQPYADDNGAADNVEEFLKRANSIEFDLPELVSEKNKYYTSRSVPSTPLPYKREGGAGTAAERRTRETFAETYANVNGAASKSVPSTPQFAEERSVFSYSNRDFLINGNSVAGGALASPLHDMLRDDLLAEPLTPALLADLDKIDAAPYDL